MSSKGHHTTNATAKELCRKYRVEIIGNAYRLNDRTGLEHWLRKENRTWSVYTRKNGLVECIDNYPTLTSAIEAVAA
jgi:hypothetical protein